LKWVFSILGLWACRHRRRFLKKREVRLGANQINLYFCLPFEKQDEGGLFGEVPEWPKGTVC
ncbi:MAG TPA: hypothetical protein VK666_09280, partial [Chryseolinea sp.]|nr:hypothetical protein [Chryseolinea sp.]